MGIMINPSILYATCLLYGLFCLAKGNSQVLERPLRSCSTLSSFQYTCERPIVDPETQRPVSCQPDNSITLTCKVADGFSCIGLQNNTNLFTKKVGDACDYYAHVEFTKALLLSVFLGFLGLDRIYLGYYAVGLFKMFSMGGVFILWFTDIVLITLQILTPADGTSFKMPYYGPRVEAVRFQNGLTIY